MVVLGNRIRLRSVLSPESGDYCVDSLFICVSLCF